ncbi:hypothetical protein BVX95_02025 [archaeon D22]|nr:hypothetical protein BVX95_02025 [archaeon D22]
MEEKFDCPAQQVLDLLGQKWTLMILRVINQNKVQRFNEIYKALKPISPKTLSVRLEELEKKHIISKKVYNEIPPKVEYTLTKEGNELIECFKHIDKWVKKWK